MSTSHGRPKEGSLPLGGTARSAKGAQSSPHCRPKEGSLPLGGTARSAKGAHQTSAQVDADGRAFGPWNPGIRSQVPDEILHLCTTSRPENVFTSVSEAAELRDLTGLETTELVVFKPRRLALHELLVRVTADIAVPDGSRIEDLGINFRRITKVILERYVAPHFDAIDATYESVRRELGQMITTEVEALFAASTQPVPTATRESRGVLGLLKRTLTKPPPLVPDASPETLINDWQHKAHASPRPCEQAGYRALSRVISALLVRHGGVWASRNLIASLATHLACNSFASDEIGRRIEPLLIEAARIEGYRLLTRQEQPVVMNTKGASASGKSTLRPLQKTLAGDIGVDWSDFALISPDIWRKQLLDYATLGAAFKYAGACTGEELQIVDQKLDRYMARKAERGDMSHLLIDRFRFDSFAPDSDEAGSNLLTRFGQIVYLFFMITPPELLVERAWNRGVEVGRYKAVDDTLAHAVEAYSGMPQLFFTWIQHSEKDVHFEFLDNSVQHGQTPRTVAFGRNDTLNVLDLEKMLDVERFRKVSIAATTQELLYPDSASLAAERNVGFLKQCVERFRHINVAEQDTARVYLRIDSGHPVWADREVLERAGANQQARASLLAMAPSVFDGLLPAPEQPIVLGGRSEAERVHTLGQWGGRR